MSYSFKNFKYKLMWWGFEIVKYIKKRYYTDEVSDNK